MAALRISSRGALVAVAAVMAAAVFGTASAATYTVGEPDGSWNLNTNYVNWVSSKKFHPGDQIVFKYSPQAHDVLEVNKAAYDSCSTSNAIATHTNGSDTIALTSTGTRYFICGFPSHCTNGMKIQINVVSSSSSTPAPAGAPNATPGAPNATPGAPNTNSPPPKPSSAATSVKATAGFGLAVLLAGLMA